MMKSSITKKMLMASVLIAATTGATAKASAQSSYVLQGPFVTPQPGPIIPNPGNVPGKEYSNRIDVDQFGSLTQGQTLLWDGAGGVKNGVRFNQNGEVDAMSNANDALFDEVTQNRAALLFSTQNDNRIWAETIVGAGFIWATLPQINSNGVNDVDSLEIWGPEGQPDANMYSLSGDATSGASVYRLGGVTVFTVAQIASAIGRPDLANVLDVDGMMTGFNNDPAQGPQGSVLPSVLMFSIAPVDLFDGGEIWVWDGSNPAQYLNHGGHLWNTAFNVQATFGTASENVNALEAAAVPEPITMLGAGAAVAFGAAFKRRKASQK